MRQEAKLRETLSIGQDILKRCHPDALTTLKHWLSVLRSRWEEVGKTQIYMNMIFILIFILTAVICFDNSSLINEKM